MENIINLDIKEAKEEKIRRYKIRIQILTAKEYHIKDKQYNQYEIYEINKLKYEYEYLIKSLEYEIKHCNTKKK